MYDTIIIGAGIAGSVLGRKLAEEGGENVLILERRDHIGGNCYDMADAYGVLVHMYGPHIFHTDMEDVWQFLSRFTEWHMFRHQVVANINGRLMPVPFNLNTLAAVYGSERAERLEEKLVQAYGAGSRVQIMQLRENPDPDIREIAEYVYQNIFLHYTMKQWGQRPEEISREVTGRVPVLVSHDNSYFPDKYQGMPLHGYTAMFRVMLDAPGITVETGMDCRERVSLEPDGTVLFDHEKYTGRLVYTGAIDELFGCVYGRLPYRSLRFVFEHYGQPDFQGHGVVNYTVSEDFTRITEFKHLTGQKDVSGTTIVREYPFSYTGAEGEIPYYAILNEGNQALYEKYCALAGRYSNLYLLGRLAEYKYYNIDAMTKKAMTLADMLLAGKKEERRPE